MTIAHASLTGDQIHEPKGVDTASLGQVYVSDGIGSGAWTNIAATSFTGMIADFTTPIAPAGWLECDGSVLNTTTYDGLYNVMTIQRTGTRTNSSTSITGLSTTTGMKVGYYVFGTGLSPGTVITQINGGTSITISIAASSSGSSTVIVSPWSLGAGTIQLPNLTAAGYYRRSRSTAQEIGQVQTDQNKVHGHTISGATGVDTPGHSHIYSGTTSADGAVSDANHNHQYTRTDSGGSFNVQAGADQAVIRTLSQSSQNTTDAGAISHGAHTHTFSGTSGTPDQFHTHTFTGSTSDNGGGEVRVYSVVFMTCVKI